MAKHVQYDQFDRLLYSCLFPQRDDFTYAGAYPLGNQAIEQVLTQRETRIVEMTRGGADNNTGAITHYHILDRNGNKLVTNMH